MAIFTTMLARAGALLLAMAGGLLLAVAGGLPAQAADPSLPAKAEASSGDVSNLRTCAYGTYTVIAGDTCVKVYHRVYCDRSALYSKYNGEPCTDKRLKVGLVLCRPARKPGSNECY